MTLSHSWVWWQRELPRELCCVLPKFFFLVILSCWFFSYARFFYVTEPEDIFHWLYYLRTFHPHRYMNWHQLWSLLRSCCKVNRFTLLQRYLNCAHLFSLLVMEKGIVAARHSRLREQISTEFRVLISKVRRVCTEFIVFIRSTYRV